MHYIRKASGEFIRNSSGLLRLDEGKSFSVSAPNYVYSNKGWSWGVQGASYSASWDSGLGGWSTGEVFLGLHNLFYTRYVYAWGVVQPFLYASGGSDKFKFRLRVGFTSKRYNHQLGIWDATYVSSVVAFYNAFDITSDYTYDSYTDDPNTPTTRSGPYTVS
jgi:hypothetical protein